VSNDLMHGINEKIEMLIYVHQIGERSLPVRGKRTAHSADQSGVEAQRHRHNGQGVNTETGSIIVPHNGVVMRRNIRVITVLRNGVGVTINSTAGFIFASRGIMIGSLMKLVEMQIKMHMYDPHSAAVAAAAHRCTLPTTV
jgi:hypothetical protein